MTSMNSGATGKLMLFADDMLFKPIYVFHDAALFQADVNLVND